MKLHHLLGTWPAALGLALGLAASPAQARDGRRAQELPAAPAAEAARPVAPDPAVAAPAPPAEDPVTGPLGPIIQGVLGQLPSARQGRFPVGMTLTVDNAVGNGTFLLHEHARQPLVASFVRLEPSLRIWRSLSAKLRVDVSKEWVASYSQGSTVPNQVLLGDVMAVVGMPEIYREPFTGLGFGASLTAVAPTSIESRAQTLVTGVRPAVRLDWKKWGLDVSYQLALRKNFHQYANPTVDARRGNYECPDEGRCMFTEAEAGPVYRGSDNLSHLSDGRVLDVSRRNVSHTITHAVNAGYSVFHDQLTFSASLILNSSFAYDLARDEVFSSDYAHNESGHKDSTWGTLDVSYQPWDHLGFSGGVMSQQPFWSAHRGPGIPGWDNSGTRQGASTLTPNFPFFDFVTPANNFTTFYLDVVVSI